MWKYTKPEMEVILLGEGVWTDNIGMSDGEVDFIGPNSSKTIGTINLE